MILVFDYCAVTVKEFGIGGYQPKLNEVEANKRYDSVMRCAYNYGSTTSAKQAAEEAYAECVKDGEYMHSVYVNSTTIFESLDKSKCVDMFEQIRLGIETDCNILTLR